MAASLNRVLVMGNLTRDVELRHTPSGTAVADIGLAINERRKDASGETVEETTFVEITMWGRTAEVAAEYLTKGSTILVEGRLKLDTWEADGAKRSKLKIVCNQMQMVSTKNSKKGGAPDTGVGDDANDGGSSSGSAGGGEDIPF